ncbi:hypothetical protein OAN30_02740 [Flavobacteriaceae bacterium]|nr:hypothetical protein [Flavobacteriaceae bacterium]MDB2427411.1 hypothetical protein [Flavobacteriaceae bacterium]MDC0331327.1 hypothetical protein [Flavobacteriaceae bacterium]
MTLKVIRYKNYGCQMTSEDYEDKFYFSFYELSNGEIIELMLFQSHNEGMIIDQYEFSYTKMKLKSGEIRNYKFGDVKANDAEGMSKEFHKWLDSSPPAVDVIDWFALYDEEEKCVKDFYKENVEPIKHIKTDTIEVKP